jgi:SIR2-like domain
MVLTETDYLDFLINLSKEEILPDQISTALNSTSLLFVGYRLRDINFHFIFRSLMQLLGEGIAAGLQLPSISVQLPSGFTEERKVIVSREHSCRRMRCQVWISSLWVKLR